MNWEHLKEAISQHLDESFSPSFREDITRLVHRLAVTFHGEEPPVKEADSEQGG